VDVPRATVRDKSLSSAFQKLTRYVLFALNSPKATDPLKMLTLLRFELVKLVRSRTFFLSLASLTVFVFLMLWGFYTYAERKVGEQATSQFKYTYESKSYFNGLTFALYSVMFSFSLLLPIFVAIIASAQIAGEKQTGTLRMICVRPVSRTSLLFSKFVVVILYTYVAVVFFIGLNLLVGLSFVGWGDLQLYPGALNLVDEPGRLLRNEALWRFAFASISGTWALLVVAAVAILFSVLVDNPTAAAMATLALYLSFLIVGRVEFFEQLKPYFFTTDMDFWRDVFKPEIPWRSSYHYASICAAYVFSLLLAAVVIFDRKDITS
jgi:ABC-2 type transport system permease protein